MFAQRVVVGVGDLGVSNNTSITLSTYALGSCVAVAVYDPVAKAGGLLHMMLPDSTISPEKAIGQPAMFADTGLPMLFRALTGIKADRSRLRLFVAGGASVLTGNDNFKIGERNIRATQLWLQQQGYGVRGSAVGGYISRTVHLDIGTGSISLKTPMANEKFSLAA
ncbi:MAG: chemotaxis protein CheD [Verrucomicrobia bacterium]|nr:chemotaxis protein CheD [Verrucomicrobiota bacterium]